MRIIAVDDERIALERLLAAIKEAQPNALVNGFRKADEALAFAEKTPCDVAFLDVEMREMDGISLAKGLKLQSPKINVIFTTGYSEYANDAFALHASGYVMKPITAEKITTELAELRNPIAQKAQKRVSVHTFGCFEVYLDGKPVEFKYAKTKEMFAYLIDRQGALCSNNEIMAILWEDKDRESYFKNMRVDLLKSLPLEIFTKQWGKLAILPDMVSCDYYDWIRGDLAAINAYNGEYMSQYAWCDGKIIK